ncbi:MAG: outer membrane beta-barrel protein [Longimicrobiales bacterium]
MHRVRLAALLVAAALLPAPAALAAQASALPVRSDPTGFHLAAHLAGAAIAYEGDGEAESGGGAGLALGWGVNRTVTLFLEAAGANVEMAEFDDTYTLAHVDLGVRLNFRGPQARALPYLTLAYSGRAAELDLDGDPFTITGAAPSFGGGVLVFLSRSAALDVGLRWTVGSFSEAEYQGEKADIDIAATSARFDLGIAWWAGR